jgi:NAD(P)-dependent dehydrogenase (short-subunit alcohol dehydrogenase family)
MKIAGCIALVTGANRGLGEALVSALLEAGAAKVYAAARDEKKVTLRSPRVVPLTLDTTKPQQIAAAAGKASDATLLINNAGSLTSFNVLATSAAQLEQDLRTNVYGTLAVIQAFVPILERARGGAAIVNVLSMTALASAPGMGGYSASKAAAYSITQGLRPQLKAKGIEVLAALPGPIDTDMAKALQLPKAKPADVAQALLAGIERGDEEIFPDPLSQQTGPLWSKSPKELERAFSGY